MTRKLLLAAVVAFGFAGASNAADTKPAPAPINTLTELAKPAATAKPAMDTSIDDTLNAAWKARDAKDFKTALDLFNKVLTQDPKNLHGICGISYVANEMKEYDVALGWANKGLRLDPENTYLLLEAGYANWKLGNREVAKQQIAKAGDKNPTDAVAYDYLIQILKEEGNNALADQVAGFKAKNVKKN
jgi:tetratricopeptide (TPR) repeat protein